MSAHATGGRSGPASVSAPMLPSNIDHSGLRRSSSLEWRRTHPTFRLHSHHHRTPSLIDGHWTNSGPTIHIAICCFSRPTRRIDFQRTHADRRTHIHRHAIRVKLNGGMRMGDKCQWTTMRRISIIGRRPSVDCTHQTTRECDSHASSHCSDRHSPHALHSTQTGTVTCAV